MLGNDNSGITNREAREKKDIEHAAEVARNLPHYLELDRARLTDLFATSFGFGQRLTTAS